MALCQRRSSGKRKIVSNKRFTHSGRRNNARYNTFGWLLDIARGIYTLRYRKVIAKTAAGRWALDNNLCPVRSALEIALKVRMSPVDYLENQEILDFTAGLGPDIQSFADVLEKELHL